MRSILAALILSLSVTCFAQTSAQKTAALQEALHQAVSDNYDSQRALKHLQEKYDYLLARSNKDVDDYNALLERHKQLQADYTNLFQLSLAVSANSSVPAPASYQFHWPRKVRTHCYSEGGGTLLGSQMPVYTDCSTE